MTFRRPPYAAASEAPEMELYEVMLLKARMVARNASQFEDTMTDEQQLVTELIRRYEVGNDVWVEDVQSHCWDKATIIKPIRTVADCYEVEFLLTKGRSIVHKYRLRKYDNG